MHSNGTRPPERRSRAGIRRIRRINTDRINVGRTVRPPFSFLLDIRTSLFRRSPSNLNDTIVHGSGGKRRTPQRRRAGIYADNNSKVMVNVYPPCFIFWRKLRINTKARLPTSGIFLRGAARLNNMRRQSHTQSHKDVIN